MHTYYTSQLYQSGFLNNICSNQLFALVYHSANGNVAKAGYHVGLRSEW